MHLHVTIGHLTGTDEVDTLIPGHVFQRERRSVSQMFFAPYESGHEFFYCANHIVFPVAIVGSAIVYPITSGVMFGIMGGMIACSGILAGITKLFHCDSSSAKLSTFFLTSLETFVNFLLQTLLDTVLLPVSFIILITRSISTGVHAVIGRQTTDDTNNQAPQIAENTANISTETTSLLPTDESTSPAPNM